MTRNSYSDALEWTDGGIVSVRNFGLIFIIIIWILFKVKRMEHLFDDTSNISFIESTFLH